jgi:Phosphotransferase system IIC components, glucose/maltose/N-acetylglucosamine-specific
MVNNYSQSVLPIILSVWIMSYVEKFFKKYMPDSLTTIFTPFLTMMVMVPVSLCLLAPAGAFLGKYISEGLIGFGKIGGFVAVAIIAALWEFLVMSGMHMVLLVTGITIIMNGGSESLIFPAGGCATWAAFGMALGAFLRLKNKEEKTLSMGYFISGIVGGVTEPTLYGIGFKYKRPFLGMMIGAAAGGLYAGLTHVGVYVMGATNFLAVLGFVGGGTSNLVNGIIASVISLVGSTIAVYVLGIKEENP